jgi:hypothetical protein
MDRSTLVTPINYHSLVGEILDRKCLEPFERTYGKLTEEAAFATYIAFDRIVTFLTPSSEVLTRKQPLSTRKISTLCDESWIIVFKQKPLTNL